MTLDQTDQVYANKWWSMFAVGLSILMGTLTMSSVAVSLPTMVEQLNTDFATIQWVVLGYILVITSLMLGAARLGDMFGKKKLFIFGLVLFTIGSLLSGLAPGVGWLITFRAIQGCGSAMTQALGSAIIVEAFPPEERGRAMGLIGSIVSVGIASGPAIGGIVLGYASWRWIFLMNVPLGVVTFFVALRFLPSRSPERTGERFDAIGALILLATLGCFALGMTTGENLGFGDGLVRVFLLAAVAGMALFLIVEVRTAQPMVDLSLFRSPLFTHGLLMGFISFVVWSGMFIIPFFLQLVKQYPTEQMGLMMMATPVAMGLIAPTAGTLSDRYGTRSISVIGLLIVAGGLLCVTTLHSDVTVLGFLLRVVPLGLGMGVFQSPNNSAIMGEAPPERLGIASGLMALSRNLGTTTGIPLAGAIFTTIVLSTADLPRFTDITTAPVDALVRATNGTIGIAAVAILISTLLSVAVIGVDRTQAK